MGSRIFCVSGGISPHLGRINEIKELQRPLEVPEEGLVTDLLWADPDEEMGWNPNQERGLSYTFGPDVFQDFCERNEIQLVVRGMQLSQGGFEYSFNKRLVNVFTCADYCGEYGNLAAVMLLDKDLQHTFWVMR